MSGEADENLSTANFNFDENRFKAPGSEGKLLLWLKDVERTVEGLPEAELQASADSLHKTFTKLLIYSPSIPNTSSSSSSSSLPKPGRPARQIIARSLIKLHTRIESKNLFDLVQELLRVVVDNGGNVLKGGADGVYRVACWYVIGELMKAHGANMMSLMSEIAVTVVKIVRATSQPVLLRAQAISALTKSLSSAGRAVPDPIAKDLLRYLKNGLGDTALAVQRTCSEALVALQGCTTVITTLNEIENIITLVVKNLDKADHPTRRAMSKLVAHLLAFTQDAASVVVPPPDRKNKKQGPMGDDQEDPVTIVTSAAAEVTKSLLTPLAMFKILSTHFNRLPVPARRARNAMFDIYATLLERLGSGYVEAHYAEILEHFVGEVIDHARNKTTPHEAAGVREMVGLILREVIAVRSLSEQGQGMAVREIADKYLKRWPALLPGATEPSEMVLLVILREMAELLRQLGTAAPVIQDAVQEPLLRLLSHPRESVRLHSAWCLRVYCSTTPLRLPKVLNALVEALDKDIGLMGNPSAPSDLSARANGKATAIGALMAVIPDRPLYVSHDISTRVLDTAVQLLKRSGEHDFKVAEVEVHVAWTLMSGLMTLGPTFVASHLPQLLVLWRNSLPKPTSKDTSVGERGEKEWAFLLDVRECTLSAILTFLQNNKELTTLDVARRLTSLLTNTLNFVNGFATAYSDYLREQQQNPNVPVGATKAAMTLAAREHELRRRVLQCFGALGNSSATEGVQPALVQAAVGILADPDVSGLPGTQPQASANTSTGPFTDVWSTSDGYGYGVCSADATGGQREATTRRETLNRDLVEQRLQDLLTKPVLAMLENDRLTVLNRAVGDTNASLAAVPAATGVIDAALALFEVLLIHQSADTLMQATTLMTNHLRSPKLDRNPGRKQAVLYNIIMSLKCALAHGERIATRKARENMSDTGVLVNLRALLQDAVVDREEPIREAAGAAFGSLIGIAGGSYVNNQTQWLVDQLVQNRVPESRAGCALALSCVYERIGGLSAGSLLKTLVNVLSSLSTDPHPVVHFWSLRALSRIVDFASLAYSPFVDQTMDMIATSYMAETHEPDGGSVGSANMRGELLAYPALCRLLHTLIGVIGPEMQEVTSTQETSLMLVKEFGEDRQDGLAVEAIRCTQQILMFAPNAVDTAQLVTTFQAHLEAGHGPLRIATITALYQVVQRDAALMSKLGGNRLVEILFGLLDEDPTIDGVRQIILSWIQQTSATMPAGWIALCQRIINKSTTAPKQDNAKSVLTGFQDDEGQSLGTGTSALEAAAPARWRTQLFALECVHAVVVAVVASGRREHFDIVAARQSGLPVELLLVARLSDLIKMAFAASTASTSEVRLQGLQVLQDVVINFAKSPDPDFPQALLLEQHQAPIAAALTPSFGTDSAPEVLASAIDVCAVFIGSGVVREVSRMGRILKLLTGALMRCNEGTTEPLGDVENLSSNAAVTLKLAALTAWAQLRVSSETQIFLQDVVKPHQEMLNRLWVGMLKDYALLRVDPESGSGLSSGGMDLAQSGLGRETLLPYYQKSATVILEALALAMKANDASILEAFGYDKIREQGSDLTAITIRPGPLPNFFVVYGMAFETISRSFRNPAAKQESLAAAKALQTLVKPIYSGAALFSSSIFDELCTLCYRIAIGEGAALRTEMMQVMSSFASSRGPSGDQDLIRRVVAVITYTLRVSVGTSEAQSNFLPSDAMADKIQALTIGFQAFTSAIAALDAGTRFHAFLVGIQLYTDLLRDESHEQDVAGPTLPAFKLLLDAGYTHSPDQETLGKAIHSVLSAALSNLDEVRGRDGPAAVVKAKNSMLLMVLILTNLGASVRVSQDVVEQACYTIGQRVKTGGQVGLVAMQCTRALLQSANRGNTALQLGVSQLVPELVQVLAAAAETAENVQPDDPVIATTDEVIKILASFVASFDEESKPRVYMVLIPSLIMLLTPERANPIHNLAVRHLLVLAGQAPTAFKDAANTLDPQERERLETSIRQSVASNQAATSRAPVASKPQISLKSFS